MKTFFFPLFSLSLVVLNLSASAAVLSEWKFGDAISSPEEAHWTQTPDRFRFGDFKYREVRIHQGEYIPSKILCGPETNFKLTKEFQGDETIVCFGNYTRITSTGQKLLGYAVCVLEAVQPGAKGCDNVELEACRADPSIEFIEKKNH